MTRGDPGDEGFWADFLCGLRTRGLSEPRLVISDFHEGLGSAIARVFPTTHSRPPPRSVDALSALVKSRQCLLSVGAHGWRRVPPGSVRNTARVGVVIPTRNRLGLLREAVDSIRQQTLANWALVVVDDASDDGTWQWLTSLADPRIRPLRQDAHLERSAARNRGLAECRSEFVLFLDDDDRLRPRALERLLEALTRRPHVVAAVGAVDFDGSGYIARDRGHPRLAVCRKAWAEAVVGWFAPTGTALFKRQVVEKVGAWNDALASEEDHDLWLRVTRHGPVAFIPWTVLNRRVHGGQQRRSDVTVDVPTHHASLMSGGERQEATRLLRAREAYLTAPGALRVGDWGLAFDSLLRTLRCSPALALSPLLGPHFVFPMARAAAGLLLVRAARRKVREGAS